MLFVSFLLQLVQSQIKIQIFIAIGIVYQRHYLLNGF